MISLTRRDRRKLDRKKLGIIEAPVLDNMTCVTSLTKKDVNNALKQQHFRFNGILYDVPVLQLEKMIKLKKFGPVQLTLTKSDIQILPTPILEANITANNKKELASYLRNHKPSINEKGSPLLKLVREDCGCKFEFKTEKDIPLESLHCKHDNKIIIYSEL